MLLSKAWKYLELVLTIDLIEGIYANLFPGFGLQKYIIPAALYTTHHIMEFKWVRMHFHVDLKKETLDLKSKWNIINRKHNFCQITWKWSGWKS